MENALKRALLRADEPPHPTIEAIREVCAQMTAVESRFSLESDPDLIEGCIYEMEALRAKYRYWLRVARQEGIACREKFHLWNE